MLTSVLGKRVSRVVVVLFVAILLGVNSAGYAQEISSPDCAERFRYAPGPLAGGSKLAVISSQSWAPLTKKVWQVIEAAQRDLADQFGKIPTFDLAVRVLDEEGYIRLSGAPQWTQAIFRQGEILLSLASFDSEGLANFYRSVRHEYTHAVVHALSGGRAPGWIDEGLAQRAEGHPAESLQKALDSWLTRNQPIRLGLLRGGFTKLSSEMVAPAYAQSLVATNYLLDRHGPRALREFFELLKGGHEESEAFKLAFSVSESDFEAELGDLLSRSVRTPQ
jgi:hypothetical protein